MSQHTPGPWHVDQTEHTYGSLVVCGAQGEQVACLMDNTFINIKRDEGANASLIAKASEMLELAKHVIQDWQEDGAGDPETVDEARVLLNEIGKVYASDEDVEVNPDQVQADARLIAKAPEMLEVVKRVALTGLASAPQEDKQAILRARALLKQIE